LDGLGFVPNVPRTTPKPQEVHVLVIATIPEFQAYLKMLHPSVDTMVIDASPDPNRANTFQPLEGIQLVAAN
jgi:hypothetical protein